jgi:pimeloyl-[acyl-carrier protein] methyl ester esterase
VKTGHSPNAKLVLLLGLDGTGLLFKPVLDALPTELRPEVIRYPADQSLDLGELAALVLRQLPSSKAVLLAESFSGLVALALLVNAPSRIQGVIFVGAFAEPPRPLLLRFAPLVSQSAALMRSTPSFMLRQFCLGKDATAGDLNILRETVASVSPAVLAQRLALIGMRHSFGRARFDVPACYLRPSDDKLVPASAVKWFQQRFKKLAVEEIDGPHFLLQAKPRESARAIEKAMQALVANA